MAALAVPSYFGDLAFSAFDPGCLGDPAQIGRVERSVEMKGIGDAIEAGVRDMGQPREAVLKRHGLVQRIVAEAARDALRPAPKPILLERQHAEAAPDLPRSDEPTSEIQSLMP